MVVALYADAARAQISSLPDSARGVTFRLGPLQADAVVTLDSELARGAEGLVEIAPIGAFASVVVWSDSEAVVVVAQPSVRLGT